MRLPEQAHRLAVGRRAALAGIEPLAICVLLARLGTADPVEPVTSLDALVTTVDVARVGRAAARFSEDELAHLSARTLRTMPYAAVRERLPVDLGEGFWLAVRGNLARLADARIWAAVVRGPIAPRLEEPAFLSEAAKALPPEPWTDVTWKAWTSALIGRVRARARLEGEAA